jgi:hypothetical protein
MKTWSTFGAIRLTSGAAAQVLAATLLLLGCESAELPAAGDGTTESAQQQGLTLSVVETGHLVGSFTRAGVRVDFDSTRGDAGFQLTLKNRRGETLLEIDDDAQAKLQTIRFGQRLRQTVSHRLLTSPTLDSAPDPGEFQSAGEANAAVDFGNTPEYALLPQLSRALGELGFDGRSYPAALPLHLLALRANENLERGLPSEQAQAHGEPSAPGLETQGLQPGGTCYPIKCPSGGTACLGGNGCYSGIEPQCPTNYGQDLQSDPCHNQCYGMCGSECSCWSWVCGDCNYHSGCAAHDDWCRSCSWYAPWNCALCYSPTALVGLDCRL